MNGEARLESELTANLLTKPTAIQQSETWFVRKNHETRIQTVEINIFVE